MNKQIEEAIEQEIERRIVRERVRIWNQIFTKSSVSFVEDGKKNSQIISIGEAALSQIILPPTRIVLDDESKDNS